jgi:hypothetical protein
MNTPTPHTLRAAAPSDVNAIIGLIRELAEFEKLAHLVVITPQRLSANLFGRGGSGGG